MTDIIERLAREAGASIHGFEYAFEVEELHSFAALVAEECAKVCESQRDPWAHGGYQPATEDCAKAIRNLFSEPAAKPGND